MEDNWADFLNPDSVRKKLIQSGLFLLAHEMLIGAIKDRLHDLFSNRWAHDKGWLTSEEYRRSVLRLDPKGKNDPFRASVAWLRKHGAINEQDEQLLSKFTSERNILAHEMRNIVGGSYQHDFDALFTELIELISKIETWWTINVEIATDPDFSDQEVDERQIVTGGQLVLNMLKLVALGKDEDAWILFRVFEAERSKASRT